jgi:hypothetical protein
MTIDIVAYLKFHIADIEEQLARHKEKNPHVNSFYGISIDEDGIPYSHGNYDDCYSDGFENGCRQGELAALRDILEKITLGPQV